MSLLSLESKLWLCRFCIVEYANHIYTVQSKLNLSIERRETRLDRRSALTADLPLQPLQRFQYPLDFSPASPPSYRYSNVIKCILHLELARTSHRQLTNSGPVLCGKLPLATLQRCQTRFNSWNWKADSCHTAHMWIHTIDSAHSPSLYTSHTHSFDTPSTVRRKETL